MNWLEHPVRYAVVAAAALAIPASPAIAQTMVVKSSGPSAKAYPPGRKFPGNGKVRLKAGDRLTLLDKNGTRTVRGPGVFSTAAANSRRTSANSGVGALLAARRITHARTGAVRGVEVDTEPARSPSLWYVDVTKSQTVCEPDFTDIRLWRPDIAGPATYTISVKGDYTAMPVKFPKGQAAAAWPSAKLPVAAGVTYQMKGPDNTEPVDIAFAHVEKQAPEAQTLAETLIAHDCTAQLDLLVDTVPSG